MLPKFWRAEIKIIIFKKNSKQFLQHIATPAYLTQILH